MSQTTYDQAPAVLTEGLVIEAREVIDCIVDDTNGKVKFGRAVRFKTMPAPGVLPVIELVDAAAEITGDTFAGIVTSDRTVEIADGATEFAGYSDNEVCSVLRRGKIAVVSESAITAYQQMFARHVAGASEDLGALRHDDDGGSDATAIPGSRAVTTFGADGLGIMELDVQD